MSVLSHGEKGRLRRVKVHANPVIITRALHVYTCTAASLSTWEGGEGKRAALALVNRVTSARRILETIDGISAAGTGVNPRRNRVACLSKRPPCVTRSALRHATGTLLHLGAYLAPALRRS